MTVKQKSSEQSKVTKKNRLLGGGSSENGAPVKKRGKPASNTHAMNLSANKSSHKQKGTIISGWVSPKSDELPHIDKGLILNKKNNFESFAFQKERKYLTKEKENQTKSYAQKIK